jgi:hypothetical protein
MMATSDKWSARGYYVLGCAWKLLGTSGVSEARREDLEEGLQAAGFKDVFAHIMKDTGHGIAPDGLQVALAFMRQQLGMD